MSSFGTGIELKSDGINIVYVFGSPDLLQELIYEPSGVNRPEDFTDDILRLMCRWAVGRTGQSVYQESSTLKITTKGHQAEFKNGDLDVEIRRVMIPDVDQNRLDP